MKNKTIARYGLMTALMLILGFLESRIPFPVPGIKLGLANTVLLYALYILGGKAALVLMALKVILSGLSFSGLSAMMYSAAGSALSLGPVSYTHLYARSSGVGDTRPAAISCMAFKQASASWGWLLSRSAMANPRCRCKYPPGAHS